jgi:hypothetical protein
MAKQVINTDSTLSPSVATTTQQTSVDFNKLNTKTTNVTSTSSTNIGTLSKAIGGGSGKVFEPINQTDDVISNVKQKVTETIWSNGESALSGSSMYISIPQYSASCEYYLDIYCSDPAISSSATTQYAIGYADRYGLGTSLTPSTDLSRTLTYVSSSVSPTAAMYSQYRNLLLPPGTEQFTMQNGQNMNSFYFVNFSRNRLKEKLDPGNWELNIVSGSTSVTMIDDAGNETVTGTYGDGGRIYAVVSGSIVNGPYLDGNNNKVVMGIAYPDLGMLLFNASGSFYSYLDTALPCQSSPLYYNTNTNLFKGWMTNAAGFFKARNSQEVTSTYYFIRVKHNDFNFSNNPSFTTGSLGDFRHSSMINNPSTYVTSVGLYNDANELLAIAKLSKPLLKTFERESLIRVCLNF